MDRCALLATQTRVPIRVRGRASARRRRRARRFLVDAVRQAERRRGGSALVAGRALLEKCGDALEPVRMMQRRDEMIAFGAEMRVERLRRRVVEQ